MIPINETFLFPDLIFVAGLIGAILGPVLGAVAGGLINKATSKPSRAQLPQFALDAGKAAGDYAKANPTPPVENLINLIRTGNLDGHQIMGPRANTYELMQGLGTKKGDAAFDNYFAAMAGATPMAPPGGADTGPAKPNIPMFDETGADPQKNPLGQGTFNRGLNERMRKDPAFAAQVSAYLDLTGRRGSTRGLDAMQLSHMYNMGNPDKRPRYGG